MASRTVRIAVKDSAHQIVLIWDRFDGDDCFDDFCILIEGPNVDACRYEFGPCAIRAVRKMKLFLSDQTQQSVSGGFRYPDIRTYDWQRVGPMLTLTVKFEGSLFEAQHMLVNPDVSVTEELYSYGS